MTLEERINQYYDTFTANDRYICECILNHKEACIHNSISEFATIHHISTSTLSRFAQKLGLPGFSELRVILRQQDSIEAPSYQDKPLMMNCYRKVIEYIDQKDCSIMFERMLLAKRIIIFGENNAQGRVAKEMKRIFLPTGKKIYDMYGLDMLSALNSFVNAEDIVILISFHGNTKEILTFASHLRMCGIFTISITNMASNPLAQYCNENLYISSLVLQLENEETYETTTPYFILIELLYLKFEMYYMDMNIIP